MQRSGYKWQGMRHIRNKKGARVSIGNEWEKNILERSSGQEQDLGLLGRNCWALWVREQCQLSLRGKGSSPPSCWHLWARLRQMSSPRAARPAGQHLPPRCPGGVTRTMGRSGYPVASPQHMPGCAWSRNPGPLPRDLVYELFPSLEMEAKHDDETNQC